MNYMSCTYSPSRLIRTILAGLAAVLLVGQQAHAALQGCPDEAAAKDKLLIGSMDLVRTISERKRRALLAAFEMHFDKADASLGSLANVIYCPQRQMRDSDNYDANVTGVLNDERVLLEVGARVSGDDIIVAYVVIPLRHYEYHNARPPRMPGYHEALYEQTQIDAGLADLFRGNAELRLMAALALGLRHEKAAEAVPAQERKTRLLRSRAFYCDAIGTLEAARPRPDFLGLEQAEWEDLGDFAHAGAERVYQQAIADFGDQSVLPILQEIRGDGSADSGVCVDPLPPRTDSGGGQ
ncbi:hypothetical protein [Ruegeria lacuscaerulensis]|uniref:hypothetical protein n=1 Tax=Ruegeria lacuscaerulensis TaxID=55218 RepID=UPI00147E6A23|nr:hypothetical protein [Ruegeria lacuscaerulensis]